MAKKNKYSNLPVLFDTLIGGQLSNTTLNKEQFLQQYVLNRSANCIDTIDPNSVIIDAEIFWNEIQKRKDNSKNFAQVN